MINEVKINNFKSVRDLTLKLGRFNVLIGSNGSGKSNILEAIAFGGAASADKLDNEFLSSRGIRATEEKLMKNAFNENSFNNPIELFFKNGGKDHIYNIEAEKGPILKWIIKEKKYVEEAFLKIYTSLISGKIEESEFFKTQNKEERNKAILYSNEIRKRINENDDKLIIDLIQKSLNPNSISEIYKQTFYSEELANFIIYSPLVTFLRKIEEESQIKPLGIKGEGLFNILQIFNENYHDYIIDKLKNYLHMIDWFDDFEAKYDNVTGTKRLLVKDRFAPGIFLNQGNVNEGFLFIMFYASLFLSKETPSFFAIDNIEASFHPRLCEEMTRNLVQLSKTQNKQAIITTHNPFVLDGLDLNDSEQKLFVVRRNADGETIADIIDKQPKDIKLSEAWMRGYIGGHPETF